MRKSLAMALAALILGATTAGAAAIGVGAFGGASVPVLNDLSKQGSMFGVRVPVSLLPILTVEPFFSSSSLGDVTQDIGGISYTRDGGKSSAFGANALLTFGAMGFRLFPFAGIGSYKLTRSGSEDIKDAGYDFGLGLGFSPIQKLSVDVRGELAMVKTGETSQKFANITAGVSYVLFKMPQGEGKR